MTTLNHRARPAKSRLRQEGVGYSIFTVVNTLLLILICIITVYPMYYVVIASISEADILGRNFGLLLFPVGRINTYSYQLVFRNRLVLSGFANTFLILIGGLCFNMVLTCLGAYFLALKGAILSRPIAMLILFTMYFSGGIVPEYLNIQSLGLMDTLWALIVPVSINTYNLLIMRSAFSSVPDSLVEAAQLDGASHVRILLRVFLPLSGATLAVMVLYYAVGHWNAWFRASLFIHNTKKYPLQLVLRQILLLNQNSELAASTTDAGELAKYADSIKYALIVISCVPILVLVSLPAAVLCKGRNGRRAEGLKKITDKRRDYFMLRLFAEHKLRKAITLEGVWRLTPLDGTERRAVSAIVPGIWEMIPQLTQYRGKARYEKTFVTEEDGGLLLRFGGVSHTADVLLDGQHLGHHYDAFTGFRIRRAGRERASTR